MLKKKLEELGIRQKELASAANVAYGTVNRICNHKYKAGPILQNRLRIALEKLAGQKFVLENLFNY
ncbi:MAG: helix-turn-helix transcriptional regulator [Candidatus Sabulitectum sp.]|nr:helix-turn-helix transcriptional regulator [Candidatus Sabulitectum sp.]